MFNCPQCGGDLKTSERLKRYYCDDCGYKISFEEIKKENFTETVNLNERLTVQEIEENSNTHRLNENLDKNYIIDCPHCGGEFIYENGEIYCSNCGKSHQTTVIESKIKSFKKIKKPERKIGFNCPNCGEKYVVINGEIYCKNCDKKLLKDLEELEFDKKLDYVCPKCKGEYGYDELTGKIACKNCSYQPFIENKAYVIDEDKSGILTIECDKCGSNSGYDIVGDKIICKSCGDEINKRYFEKQKHKKVIDKDGVVAKRLTKKTIKCKNCGRMVEGFDFYKTEFCPSCGTINVVVEEIESLRVEPDKIIPFVLNKDEALRALEIYGELKGLNIKMVGNLKKTYTPFWQFHFEGAKIWFKKKRSFEDKDGRVKSLILEEGKEEINLDDVWISAKEESMEVFDLNKTDMTKAINYTPEALDILTERYDVGTTEAEVIAKDIVYDYLYDMVWNRKKTFKLMFFNFLELNYGTYKNEFQQVLIPTWQSICEINNENYFFAVNGQNGEVSISGLGLEERVIKEKFEESVDKGTKILESIDELFSWFPKK